MLREFTRNVGKRFKVGEHHDYPKHVWDRVVVDARKALAAADPKIAQDREFSLDSFTKAVQYNPLSQSMMKGRGAQPHKRLGT